MPDDLYFQAKEAELNVSRLAQRENRLLRTCDIRNIDEELARATALLRTSVGGGPIPSAVDAICGCHRRRRHMSLRALARHITNAATIGSG